MLERWDDMTPMRMALHGLAAAALITVIPLVGGLLPASGAASRTFVTAHLQVAPVAGSAEYLA
jgi:hypothetical protein